MYLRITSRFFASLFFALWFAMVGDGSDARRELDRARAITDQSAVGAATHAGKVRRFDLHCTSS